MCLLFYTLRVSRVWEGAERSSLNTSESGPHLRPSSSGYQEEELVGLQPARVMAAPPRPALSEQVLWPRGSQRRSPALCFLFFPAVRLFCPPRLRPPPSSNHTSSAPDNTSASAIVAAIPTDGDFLWSGPLIG